MSSFPVLVGVLSAETIRDFGDAPADPAFCVAVDKAPSLAKRLCRTYNVVHDEHCESLYRKSSTVQLTCSSSIS